MKIRCSTKARPALAERLSLLSEVEELHPKSDLLYLIDIDRATTREALPALATGRPYVVDLGDDARTLAKGAGLGRGEVFLRHRTSQAVVMRAKAVVYRGYFQRLILEARGVQRPALWIPDSVGDHLLDRDVGERDVNLVATFGSITNKAPRPEWPAFYGAELLDVLDEIPTLRGLVILRGNGAEGFRALARERGLADRIDYHADLSVDQLFTELCRAGFVTSYQTDDLTGWSRTTGKLPLALAAGCGLLSTAVGEASRVLPASQQSGAGRAAFVAMAVRRIQTGWTARDVAHARLAAESYRRSELASRLAKFLAAQC